ncbi:hypothetical protein ACOSP7_001707 [Xanthoceras sorbifolium]
MKSLQIFAILLVSVLLFSAENEAQEGTCHTDFGMVGCSEDRCRDFCFNMYNGGVPDKRIDGFCVDMNSICFCSRQC